MDTSTAISLLARWVVNESYRTTPSAPSGVYIELAGLAPELFDLLSAEVDRQSTVPSDADVQVALAVLKGAR